MKIDWSVIALAVCLVVVIVAIVVVVHRDGNDALKGTGLGGLAVALAGALTYRVKKNGNGSQR